MQDRTVTALLDAPRDQAFAFLSQVANLPQWATEFARELRFEGDHAKIVNDLGEFYVSIVADPTTGVIDMYVGPAADDLSLFPSRVVALPGGRSAYSLTMFQAPGMPDELFESQYQSLFREFDNIPRALS